MEDSEGCIRGIEVLFQGFDETKVQLKQQQLRLELRRPTRGPLPSVRER